ncbi:MAG: MBL fold metallo-hydrolase [Sphingomonadales bacterium]
MDIKSFFDKDTFSYTYVVSDSNKKRAIIIDPVMNFDMASGKITSKSAYDVLAYIQAGGFGVDYILETHLHADHITAAPFFQDKLGGKMAISEGVKNVQLVFSKVFNEGSGFKCDGSQFDVLMSDGDKFSFGNLTLKAISTPGHTPACMTFIIGDAAFVGDTLFMPDFGTARCDFPSGNPGLLYKSIQKILSLPDETRLFMCHDYAPGGRNFICETTVGIQKKTNIHIKNGISKEVFVKMRNERDAQLSVPKLLLPSVQINMRGGKLTPCDDSGVFYLKIPVTRG